MNICMCGYQPGDYAHRPACPYPLFRGTEADCLEWEAARDDRLAAMRAEARGPRVTEESIAQDKARSPFFCADDYR